MLCLLSLESRIPADHPLRAIKVLADTALKRLSDDFDAMYARDGRPSIPPERLLKALLLIALHSIRSERQFCEQLEYNLLYRWFLDMDLMEPAFDASTFSRNRQRMLDGNIAAHFFRTVRDQGEELMSREHFSVDGTLIEAWASLKQTADKVSSLLRARARARARNRFKQTADKVSSLLRARARARARNRFIAKIDRARARARARARCRLLHQQSAGREPARIARGPTHQRSQRPLREANRSEDAQAAKDPPHHGRRR